MALLIAFIIILFLPAPFAIAGYRRHWLVPSLLELVILGYAAFLWSLPFDPTDDVQMQQLWRLIVASVAVICAVAFGAGLVASKFSQRRESKSEGLK